MRHLIHQIRYRFDKTYRAVFNAQRQWAIVMGASNSIYTR